MGILSQVEEALDEADLHDSALRQALLDGVREALSGEPAPEPPKMTVVEGGGAPSTGGSPPHLKLALESGDDRPPVRVAVSRRALKAPASSAREGAIVLAERGAEEVQQTLFRGLEPHPYRVACRRGWMKVALDGQPAETLEAGQTVDVEARLIRVSSTGGASGAYIRLR